MMRALLAKEWRALRRDGRPWSMGLVVAALLLITGALAHQREMRAQRERQTVETAARAQWDQQGARHPHRAAHFGLYAFKPRSALAMLAPGIDAHAGQALWLEPHKRNLPQHAPAADAAPSLGLGELHPSMVLLMLVPLLIVVAGHGSVTQERESGTLRLLQASGLRPRALLASKWLGLLAGTGVVLLPGLAMGAVVLAAAGSAAALGAVLVVLAVYYAVWAGLTVAVSSLCATSRGALLTLLAVWLAAMFLVPRMGAAVAQWAQPLPTGQAFRSAIQHDIEQGLPGDGPARERLQAFEARLLAQHGVTRLEDLPVGAHAARRLFRDAYASRVHALHFDRLWDAQEHQLEVLRWLTAPSPMAPVQRALSTLAGTDLSHRRHFEAAAEAYRQRFTTLIDEWEARHTRGLTSFEDRYGGEAQWRAIPTWRYVAPPLGSALRAAAIDLAWLGGWLLLAVGLMVLSARRLKP